MTNEKTWYEQTTLGPYCSGWENMHCKDCQLCGTCDTCDTIEGRIMEVVNEYASTCDGPCAELTHHDLLAMDSETQLGYCEDCIPELPREIRNRLEKGPD